MNKKRKNILKKLGVSIFLIVIFIVFSFWPLKKLISSNLLFSKTLIILTNETEIRPCGGFFTAFGESQNFPFDLEFKNIYELENFQKKEFVPIKLKPITDTFNFWDSGINENIEGCISTVKNFYNEYSEQKIENIILINYKVLESILSVLESVEVENKILIEKNVFRFLSEFAANVDRHNIKALSERKNVLKPLVKSLIKKSILNPFKWRMLSNGILKNIVEGDLYISGISKSIENNNGFGLIEWNLGGAKTSRFLKKDLDIFIQEIKPNFWRLEININLKNTLGISLPFGQTWKGGVEILIPDFIEKSVYLENLEIKNGETFEKKLVFEFEKNDFEKFSVFSSRGQNINFSGIISIFPQQEIIKSNGEIIDFTSTWNQKIRNGSFDFFWKKSIDIQIPFITFHKNILYKNLSEKLKQKFLSTDFLVEIHMNEKIELLNFLAQLQDLGKNEIFENRKLRTFEKISENAILIGFEKNTIQENEAFSIKLFGLQDLFGNKIDSQKTYTVIEKKKILKNDEKK